MPPTPEEIARGDVVDPAELAAATAAAAAEKAKAEQEKAEADAKAAADKAAKPEGDEAEKAEGEEGTDDGLDETPEEKAEREAAELEESKKKRARIPLQRHEEILANARKREEQLAERVKQLEKQGSVKQQTVALTEIKTKMDSLQEKYEDFLLDGKKAEAKAARVELEALREQYFDTKSTASSDAARRAAIEELKYENIVASIEADHPELNPDLDVFDETKSQEVVDLMNALASQGKARHEALKQAVKYVMGPPKKAETVDSKPTDELKAAREKAARQKAAAAAIAQPPATKDVGKDSDKGSDGKDKEIDVLSMTQEQFAKLDDSIKARLRGDTL